MRNSSHLNNSFSEFFTIWLFHLNVGGKRLDINDLYLLKYFMIYSEGDYIMAIIENVNIR